MQFPTRAISSVTSLKAQIYMLLFSALSFVKSCWPLLSKLSCPQDQNHVHPHIHKPTWHPKVLARWLTLLGLMLIGTRLDFEKFTWRPVESIKDLRSPLRLKRTLLSPGRIRRVSSAYCIIGKSSWKLSHSGWCRTPARQALFTIDCKRSAESQKNMLTQRRTCTNTPTGLGRPKRLQTTCTSGNDRNVIPQNDLEISRVDVELDLN